LQANRTANDSAQQPEKQYANFVMAILDLVAALARIYADYIFLTD